MYNSKIKYNNLELYSLSDDEKAAIDLNWAIGMNKKMLQILGLWTDSTQSQGQTIRHNLQTLFHAITIFFGTIFPMSLALFKVRDDMSLIVDNLITNVPITIAEGKLIISWYNRKG